MNKLTNEQFDAAQSLLDTALRATKSGTRERATVEAKIAKWEAALALPGRTYQQRQDRYAAIADVAAELT